MKNITKVLLGATIASTAGTAASFIVDKKNVITVTDDAGNISTTGGEISTRTKIIGGIAVASATATVVSGIAGHIADKKAALAAAEEDPAVVFTPEI